MKVEARLTFDKVRFDQESDAHLVVTLTAPSVSVEEKRPSLCIVPVIDVSPSMDGAKIAYAKRSLLKLIDHLTPNDYCGLVKFSSTAEMVAKPRKVTQEVKEDLKRKVGDLSLNGGTNIGDALLTGLSVANGMDLSSEVLTRVILFTDGESNTGPAQTPGAIIALVDPNIGIASVSVFGYGEDVKQDFLGDLAKKAKGNYAFVKNPDDALSAFGKELGGLLSTYATNLVIDVSPLAGHQISQVVSDVEAEEEDLGPITIKIPDLLADETRHIVLGVKLKEQKSAFPRAVNVFDVQVGYDILDANMRKERKDEEIKTKVQFVKADDAQRQADAELDKIVALAQVVRAQIEAEAFAKRGDYNSAYGTMATVSGNLSTRGLQQIGAVAMDIGSRMENQSRYAASTSYLTSMSRGATRSVGVSGYDVQAASALRSCGMSLSNSAQESFATDFANEAVVEVEAPPDQTALQDLLANMTSAINNGSSTIQGGDVGLTWGGDISGSGVQIGGDVNGTPARPLFIGGGSMHVALNPPTVTVEEAKKPAKKAKRKIKQKSSRW